MNDYEVIVGNVGSVYSGHNLREAMKKYRTYIDTSKSGVGRAGGESVMLMKNGEPHKEYAGTLSDTEV